MKLELLNRVQIIVAKREIAHHEQFLPLPQWFQESPAYDINVTASEKLLMHMVCLLITGNLQ